MHPTTAPDSGGGHTLRFVPVAVDVGADDETIVVLDTTWTPEAGTDPRLGLRDLAARILERTDVFGEAIALLDGWAEASGVVDLLGLEGTSFWYRARQWQWLWLTDQRLWLAILDDLLSSTPGVTRFVADPGVDDDLRLALGSIARRDGIAVAIDPPPASEPETPVAATAEPAPPAASGRRPRSLLQRLRWRYMPPAAERRRRWTVRRLTRLEADPGRLLVVEAHVRQRVGSASTGRLLNPYLGPVVDRLRRGPLEPIELDIRATISDDAGWARVRESDADRLLPADVLGYASLRGITSAAKAEASAVADRIAAIDTPLIIAGVDLGPALRDRLERRTRRGFGRSIVDVARSRALVRRLRPAAVLLADEYHRQDWLTAAAAEGVPTVAIQHGVINRQHVGYMHATRPPTLRLPDRTYVYGRWERDLLTSGSVYRPDEVVVGGSPRIDLVDLRSADRDQVRSELGVADGARMIVLSGSWGPWHRRFPYPIALAAVFDRPLDRVHVVVKLHPTERDNGPYRAVIESVAARGGFEAPPITVVQTIDLYRLLGAADAHLGISSTVITEAVVTGTMNLLVDRFAGGDQLGYVEAGVAIPVRDGGDVLAALDRPVDQAALAAAREAFIAAHFEPGDASGRIARDLEGWLGR